MQGQFGGTFCGPPVADLFEFFEHFQQVVGLVLKRAQAIQADIQQMRVQAIVGIAQRFELRFNIHFLTDQLVLAGRTMCLVPGLNVAISALVSHRNGTICRPASCLLCGDFLAFGLNGSIFSGRRSGDKFMAQLTQQLDGIDGWTGPAFQLEKGNDLNGLIDVVCQIDGFRGIDLL